MTGTKPPNNSLVKATTVAEEAGAHNNDKLNSANNLALLDSIISKSETKETRTPDEIAFLTKLSKHHRSSWPESVIKKVDNAGLIIMYKPNGVKITTGGRRKTRRSKKRSKKTRRRH